MIVQKFPDVSAREREQHVVHECNRRRRPFDVEEDGSDAVLAKSERHAPARGRAGGRNAGPKQTG